MLGRPRLNPARMAARSAGRPVYRSIVREVTARQRGHQPWKFQKATCYCWLLAVALWSGCATVPPLPAVDLSQPGWVVRHGQAIWKPTRSSPEIAGDILVAIAVDERSFVQFSKTPFPILVAQTMQRRWTIDFIPQRRSLRGTGAAPARFLWPYIANALLRGVPPPANWTQISLEGSRWKFSNTSSGETIEGFLTP
jgi:hypothetical protein